MNAMANTQELELVDTADVSLDERPNLDEVIQSICLDAHFDSLKFVLRSNIGQDGE
jgi:hypothetical protein